MKVINIHSREYPVPSAEVGRLVDTLSSENDLLWPHALWPRMKFNKPHSPFPPTEGTVQFDISLKNMSLENELCFDLRDQMALTVITGMMFSNWKKVKPNCVKR